VLTNQYGVGLNSHLGPVEAEYSFAVKNFEDSGDDILYAARGSNGIYPAGTWPHNMNPELHQYKHTFKLHTMYTGKITASGTVSKTGMENDFSDAERDIFNAGGAVTFTPITALTFSAKYRHRKVKNDTPASVIIRDASGTIESSEVNPRESISYLTDTINFDARYRAARWLTLRGGVDFNKETRRHTEDWGDLEDASRKWAWNVGADTRFWRSLQVKGGYTNTKAKNPAYNVQPDQAHEFKGAVTWMPMDFLNVFGSYKYTREEREDIHFVGEYLDGESHADERRAHKHDGSAMVTLLLTRWFSVHANYGYFRNYTQQDLVHATSNPPAALGSSGDFRSDPGIWYENESQVYGGGINVDPGRNFHLNAGITFVNTKGEFKYHWREVTPDPMDIGALSEVKTEDMIIHAGTRIGLPDNFGLGIDYQYSRFQERADNGFSDLDDGQAHVVMLTLTKTLGKGT